MKSLTKRQRQLLDFIEAHIAENGYPPSIREMAEHMGIRSTNGVNDHLKALERKGYLERKAGLKSRAIALTHKGAGNSPPERATRPGEVGQVVAIPLVGRVAAGTPILAEEHLEGQVQIDRDLVGRGAELFALRVQGDSMRDAGILSGDTVFVRQQPDARAGQVVVAMIEGEATVKTYRPGRDALTFEPANPDYEPIVVHRSEFRQADLLGVVVGVYRRM